MSGITTVLVADAQRLFSEALAIALSRYPDLDVVDNNHPTSGLAAVEAAIDLRPDVALLDYWMVGMEGPAAARAILRRLPTCKIMLLSWLHGPAQVQEALDAGVVGFLPKSLGVGQVVDAIRRARAGEVPVYLEELKELLRNIELRDSEVEDMARRLGSLTPREIQILTLLSFGRRIEDVASDLSIAPGTLRTHVHNILKKTGARSQLEALAMARHHGLIQT
ncbi:MAG: response regulator [Actinomycetota bacterium]